MDEYRNGRSRKEEKRNCELLGDGTRLRRDNEGSAEDEAPGQLRHECAEQGEIGPAIHVAGDEAQDKGCPQGISCVGLNELKAVHRIPP